MADDLTTRKVEQDLQNDISYYNEKIAEQVQNSDPSDTAKQAQIQQMQRERDQRLIDLQNMRANADNPNVLVK